jgi:hypothetical protein
MGCKGVDWIYLTQYRDQSWGLLNTVITFRFHEKWEISWIAEQLLASEEELCFKELVSLVSESKGNDKGKVVPVLYFNWAPRHGGVLRWGGTGPRILSPRH